MTGSRTTRPAEKDALERHRQVHFYLDRLERFLEELDPSAGEEELGRLVTEIEIFKERMVEHNEDEGKRIHQEIAGAVPGAKEKLRDLSAQHHRIIEVLEVAILHARDCLPSEVVDLRDEIRSFLKEVHRHENAEDDLIREAMSA